MKHIYKFKVLILVLLLFATSCNDFLDVMPDKRAELDSNQKLSELLVSAYPTVDPMMIYEHRSDNAMDNGTQYGNSSLSMITENYFWKDISTTAWDEPQMLWQQCYTAIGAANQVLKTIEEVLGSSDENQAIKAEALMSRAYSHFLLANTFSQPYSDTTGSVDLGIPYIEEPETVIGVKYDRGTIKEVYEKALGLSDLQDTVSRGKNIAAAIESSDTLANTGLLANQQEEDAFYNANLLFRINQDAFYGRIRKTISACVSITHFRKYLCYSSYAHIRICIHIKDFANHFSLFFHNNQLTFFFSVSPNAIVSKNNTFFYRLTKTKFQSFRCFS